MMILEDYRSQAHVNKLARDEAEARSKKLVDSMKPKTRMIVKLSKEVEKLTLNKELLSKYRDQAQTQWYKEEECQTEDINIDDSEPKEFEEIQCQTDETRIYIPKSVHSSNQSENSQQ